MFSDFPTDTAAFEVPGVTDAMSLLDHLQSRWPAWCESGVAGTFVIVLVPEPLDEFNDMLASVEQWITQQTFLAIRFFLDGRVYVMQSGGSIGPGTPA
jgi:hypothetical protein